MIIKVPSRSLSFPRVHFHFHYFTWTVGLQVEALLGGSQGLATRVLSAISFSAVAVLLSSGPFCEPRLELKAWA